MARKVDTIVTCDICHHAQYKERDLDSGRLKYTNSDWFDPYGRLEWGKVKDYDVCPRCWHTVATAFALGIAEELQWPTEGDDG